MKNLIAVAVLIVAGMVAVPAATAGSVMRVEIPFAFLAGEQMHAPGIYIVKTSAGAGYVEMRNVKSTLTEHVVLNGKRVQRNGLDPALGFLRFERYGSGYALRAIGAPHASEGMTVKPSKAEKELAKGGGAAGEVVAIAQ